jgi:5-methylcytosine-specific restriction protein A
MLLRIIRHVQDVSSGKTTPLLMRSSKWRGVELAHKKLFPACIVCGVTDSINIHHIFPFHYCVQLGRPDLELDQRNLITLCETNSKDKEQNHHLLIGHLDLFSSSNLSVLEDATVTFKNMLAQDIQSNPIWLAKKANRLKLFSDMTDKDKQDFTDLMNRTFPKL